MTHYLKLKAPFYTETPRPVLYTNMTPVVACSHYLEENSNDSCKLKQTSDFKYIMTSLSIIHMFSHRGSRKLQSALIKERVLVKKNK